jgi:hypothetical protein
MTIDEISNYVSNGRVCVEIKLLSEYPGFVRKIIFYARNRVSIEFVGNWVGENNESGYQFFCFFSSVEDAVESIESYLDRGIKTWTNHTRTGESPIIEYPFDIGESDIRLRQDIKDNKISLPKIGTFKLNP